MERKQTIWKPRGDMPPEGSLKSEAAGLGVLELTCRLLAARGITDSEAMDAYLNPGLRHMAHPDTVPGLAEGAQVLARGLAQGKRLAVWGDYDVDGITSSALIKDFLNARGLDCVVRLPHRMRDGYGVNPAGVEELAAQGVGMLLTVDCGVTDHAAVARARELGLDVVVSDHHEPGESLPEALAVCNPRLGDCPGRNLAGVGVAFLLACALNRLLPGEPTDMRRFLDLAALGTIADVVSLTGENRIIVKNGLLMIKEAARPGIAALKAASSYAMGAEMTAGQVAFGLAPRINAAGRIDEPGAALDLLLAPDLDTAKPIAKRLDALNRERQKVEQRTLEEAMEQARAMAHRPGLVLYAEHWHPGVIGIVASSVVDEFYRPAILLTLEDGAAKGSARSIPEFDLFKGLCGASNMLSRFGGHTMAAGLALDKDRIAAFADRFDEIVVQALGPEPLAPTLKYDAELDFGRVDQRLLAELEMMQPFGMGNPEPTFLTRDLTLAGASAFGKGMAKNHAKLTLRHEPSGVTLAAKAWGRAEQFPPSARGRRLEAVHAPRIDRYQNIPRIELVLKDFRFTD